ncbi:MAG: haloacid dehalogenase type II [Alphaproteobacteria bacterium]
MAAQAIKALTFDVFGTVVDWRSSIAREIAAFGRRKGLALDANAFADAWRELYDPAMDDVRAGRRPWVKLDDLHRESLVKLLVRFDVKGVSEAEIDDLNRAWHRLDPWPDVVAGLGRLKRKFILATLSNGNVALMVDMAKRAGLPWDVILGAEVAQHYKPQPEAYLRTAAFLSLEPAQCMMVAAHPGDLDVASRCGFKTAYVPRPLEYGPNRTPERADDRRYNLRAVDFLDLANQLGC